MGHVCILATNRLVRTRMLGGVGGVPGNRAPIPIFVVRRICSENPVSTAHVTVHWIAFGLMLQ